MSYYCERCDRWFKSYHSYHQHVSSSSFHDYCSDCEEDFGSSEALRQHYIQSPAHDYCRKCDTEFDDHRSLIEHCLEDHHYCEDCDRFFQGAHGLHEHNRQCHDYCVECRRVFKSENNLRMHMNSSVHRPRDVPCQFQYEGCGQMFVSKSAMMLHLESGSCISGVDRDEVNRLIRLKDRKNVIVIPQRLLTDGGATTSRYFATERSWNVSIGEYECVLCHKTFRMLEDLNRHLASPRHQEEMYRCPLSSCLAKFRTLSALCQHVESESCGILRFAISKGMDRLVSGLGRLRIQG